MPKYKALNNLELNYAFKDLKHLGESGMFIAVKLVEYFIQTVIKGGPLKFSNMELVSTFLCSRRGLLDAYKVLEADGIVRRTFLDEDKLTRGEFEMDLEKAYEWLSLNKKDDAYINAPKRSLLRNFVNQASIFVIDIKNRIIEAFGHSKNVIDREERRRKIRVFKEKLNRDYDRYTNHLQTRKGKLRKYQDNREQASIIEDAKETLNNFLNSGIHYNYTPPDNLKTA